ncbi:MAG: hypothetical protein J7551_03560, partial [Chloroflexi bacterium]|nr:hypothetical protein [Chloroflexota bacterium]
QVRDRILHDGDDWAFTAENKLLFERGKHSTRFYRWVQRWFNKEWEMARLQAGKLHVSALKRARIALGLQVSRRAVQLLAKLPGKTVEFHPAPGR